MNRQQAEQLLARLVFDELDEPTKAELYAYLGTDPELREQLADMRLTVKLLRDTAARQTPMRLTDQRRRALLAKTRRKPGRRRQPADRRSGWNQPIAFTLRHGVAIAAVLLMGLFVIALFLPALGRAREMSGATVAMMEQRQREREETIDEMHEHNEPMTEIRERISQQLPVATTRPPAPLQPRNQPGTTTEPDSSPKPVLSDGRWATALDAAQPDVTSDGEANGALFGRKFEGSGGRSAETRVLSKSEAAAGPGEERDRQSSEVQTSAPRGEPGERPGRMNGSSESAWFRSQPESTAIVDSVGKDRLGLAGSVDAGVALRTDESGGRPRRLTTAGDKSDARGRWDNVSTDGMNRREIDRTQGRFFGDSFEDAAEKRRSAVSGRVVTGAPTPDQIPLSILGGDIEAPAHGGQAFNEKEPLARRELQRRIDADKSFRQGVVLDKPIEMSLRLGGQGRVDVPGVGTIDASGLTPTQLRDRIADELGQDDKGGQKVAIATAPDEAPDLRRKLQKMAERAEADEDSALPPASRFADLPVNPWELTRRDRFSTFGLDVDTASYTLARRYIRAGYRPPHGAVRMEEFVNAFDYNYPQQQRGVFGVYAQAAPWPFASPSERTTLLKIGIRGKVIGREGRKPVHLVFVVDTSGSMARPDRLPLVQYALTLLVNELTEADRVSLVTYGTKARLMLEAVPATRTDRIAAAVQQMNAGGSTNLVEGVQLGYDIARRAFVAGQTSRVILCSDGVANVGDMDAQAILKKVEAHRQQGITFTAAGFGFGGYNDTLLEQLANRGDGNYVFIDSTEQARHVFVDRMSATLQTIAKDAKIQVEFNPRRVRRYRLIGYENRAIADEQFRDDTVDAGEVGSGQSATALYELELVGEPAPESYADLGTVYVRYRNVETGGIEEISRRLESNLVRRREVKDDPRFYLAACAARAAERFRGSEHARHGNFKQVERVLEQVCEALPLDNRARELLWMVRRAQSLPVAP